MRKGECKLKRCAMCILPESFPNIKFDDHGVCNYCIRHTPIKYRGESALRDLLNCYRRKGKKYDCIVPLSGGRDSSFTLYQIVKKYRMRVLALNYDSGFASEQAKENLKKALKILQVDFVSIKSKRDIQKRCLRDNIKAWALNPSYEVFPQLCYGCKEGYLYGAYKIAGRMGIPLIILGDSQIENLTLAYLGRSYESYFIHLFTKFMKNPSHLIPYFNPKNIFHYLLLNVEFTLPAHLYRYTTRNPPKIVHWFEYVEYNERKILSTVKDELEWKKPEKFASSWRFDCQIHAIADYMLKKKLGLTQKDELYSRMIREGTLSRDEALERIEREKENEEMLLGIIDEVFEKLGLSKEKNHILPLLSIR